MQSLQGYGWINLTIILIEVGSRWAVSAYGVTQIFTLDKHSVAGRMDFVLTSVEARRSPCMDQEIEW